MSVEKRNLTELSPVGAAFVETPTKYRENSLN